jgi:hypothetical protein
MQQQRLPASSYQTSTPGQKVKQNSRLQNIQNRTLGRIGGMQLGVGESKQMMSPDSADNYRASQNEGSRFEKDPKQSLTMNRQSI